MRRSRRFHPSRQINEWILHQIERRLIWAFALGALLFLIDCILTITGNIGALQKDCQFFLASQGNNLQLFDYSRLQEDLSRFVKDSGARSASVYDSAGLRIASWGWVSEEETPSSLKNGTASAPSTFSVNPKTLDLVFSIPFSDDSKRVFYTLQVSLPSLPWLYRPLLRMFLVLALLIFFYVRAKGSARRTSQIISDPIQLLAEQLSGANSLQEAQAIAINSEISEINELYKTFQSLTYRLEKAEQEKTRGRELAAIGEFAAQVAHDIRSPLTALLMVVDALPKVPEMERTLLRSALDRISEIANALIDRQRALLRGAQELNSNELPSPNIPGIADTPVLSLLDSILIEKRLEVSGRKGLAIEFQNDSEDCGAFTSIPAQEIKRILSNLINNSIEAIEGNGRITLRYWTEERKVFLRITDNGRGIPPERIPLLMNKGATFGKKEGTGLGLYHAKQVLENFGGSIEIGPAQNRGTQVTLSLPRSEAPAWFTRQIEISSDSSVIILDDDPFIHRVWGERFGQLGINPEKLHNFYEARLMVEFLSTHRSSMSNEILYLVDFDLDDPRTNGLGLIQKLNLAPALLVTNRYDDASLREECTKNGVTLIPKNLAKVIPIYLYSPEQKRADMNRSMRS